MKPSLEYRFMAISAFVLLQRQTKLLERLAVILKVDNLGISCSILYPSNSHRPSV